ncbi:DNA polymerase III subunit beta [Alicyclobacillus tolerans]|uniref:DNA polymerase III subunit beta n=1 Tax=Alicyclobacillus tolerans TaxID=90970 RepID=UPI001EFFFF37|nr:DNA polymerase III subunit beta [Alicyclobacillus tolerans]MCF8568016.1 DNA polymerase III subunit beta [Alicyclobacillus tolerans]
MKIVFQQTELEKTLKDVVRMIPTVAKTDMHQFVRITADRAQNRVEFVTTSHEAAIHRNVVDTQIQSPVTIYESGACLLSARKLLDIVKHATDVVQLSMKKNSFDVTISFGNSESDIHGLDPSTFVPYQNDPQQTHRVDVTALNLRSLLGSTLYACSDSETRPALTGLNFVVKDDGTLVATGTDGLRLARADAPGQVEGQAGGNLTIPKDPLHSLAAILPKDEDEMVHLELGSSVLVATWDDEGTRFVMRSLNEAYPNVDSIIPKSTKIQIRVSRSEFLEACHLLVLFSEDVENRKIRVDFENGVMRLSIHSKQTGKSFWDVPILECNAQDIDPMMFNIRNWLDLLKVSNTQEIEIGINGPNLPVIIHSVETTAMALIAPVLQASYAKESQSA